jgi:hypothetical protein
VPDFREMTLDSGARPEEQHVELCPPQGEELKAGPGDDVTVKLLLTRGRTRNLKMTVEPEKEEGT